MIYKSDFVEIDLNKGVITQSFAGKVVGENDNVGDRIGAIIVADGEPVNLAGVSCVGYFVRNGNGDTVVVNGVISGNRAYVDLPQACYAYEGTFSLSIKLVSGSTKSTVRTVTGMVASTQTGATIDPGSVVPDLTELLGYINQMKTLIDSLHPLTHAEIDQAMVH